MWRMLDTTNLRTPHIGEFFPTETAEAESIHGAWAHTRKETMRVLARCAKLWVSVLPPDDEAEFRERCIRAGMARQSNTGTMFVRALLDLELPISTAERYAEVVDRGVEWLDINNENDDDLI